MVERLVACKCSIADLNGRYVHKDGAAPSYVETRHGPVSRANVVAVVVDTAGEKTVVLDDGSGHVEARSFDDEKLFSKVKPGDVVQLIGRPRQYQGSLYLVAELCRVLHPKWLELRQAELGAGAPSPSPETTMGFEAEQPSNPRSEDRPPTLRQADVSPKEAAVERPAPVVTTSADAVLHAIRDLDDGSGADVAKVIAKAGKAAEKVVTALLAEGEIFELRPGKVKVLE